jgi:uncharacterized membrane protein YgaE (UPF0421/DUF939 family)
MASAIPFYRRIKGIPWAIRIVISCVITWVVLQHFLGIYPVWAMISAVVVSEHEFQSALATFKSRVLNTLIGCAVGLACLYLFGSAIWSVAIGVAISVLVCTNFVHIQGNWKIAPITVLIVMTPGILSQSTRGDIDVGLRRTGQVLFGGLVAVTISYLATKFSMKRQGASQSP